MKNGLTAYVCVMLGMFAFATLAMWIERAYPVVECAREAK